jgi:alanine dehydrogenase
VAGRVTEAVAAGRGAYGASTVGVPAEVKDGEGRVALNPSGVQRVVASGARVLVEAGAGTHAGYPDGEYVEVGAELVGDAAAVWDQADVLVKVKEPQPEEYGRLRPGLVLFAFLHLAADAGLTRALVEHRVRAYAFETLEVDGRLPLLAPMSEVAGRAAAVVGAATLSAVGGGSGVLPGGAAGVPPARVVVVGLGVAGRLAAHGLRGLGAHVTGVDVDLDRLLERRLDGTVDATAASEAHLVDALVRDADLVVGAALVPGGRAPVVVAAESVAAMRPGSVVVDLAVDQGGCVATTEPTTLSRHTFVRHGVVHYAVTNVPGQYPRTASAALSAATAPYVAELATAVGEGRTPELHGAANVVDGRVVHPGVARAHPDLPSAP